MRVSKVVGKLGLELVRVRAAPCVSGTVGEEIHQTGEEVRLWGRQQTTDQTGSTGRCQTETKSQFIHRTCFHSVVGTGEVEECVEDVEAIHVTTLDELVRVQLHDVWPGDEHMRVNGWHLLTTTESHNPLKVDFIMDSILKSHSILDEVISHGPCMWYSIFRFSHYIMLDNFYIGWQRQIIIYEMLIELYAFYYQQLLIFCLLDSSMTLLHLGE